MGHDLTMRPSMRDKIASSLVKDNSKSNYRCKSAEKVGKEGGGDRQTDTQTHRHESTTGLPERRSSYSQPRNRTGTTLKI